jgi:hypothetical protein
MELLGGRSEETDQEGLERRAFMSRGLAGVLG